MVVARDGETGVGLARARKPEVILLDVSLPGLDGFEACRRIREFSDAYVIMVTGRTDEVDRVVGLEMGADDSLTKPFSIKELLARVKALFRYRDAVVSASEVGVNRVEYPGGQFAETLAEQAASLSFVV